MVLRCWPGAIAFVNRGTFAGRMVEVLYLAPQGNITLPNGLPSEGSNDLPAWVVKSQGSLFSVPLGSGGFRMADVFVCADYGLTPIQPGREPESTNTDTTAPADADGVEVLTA